MQALRPLLLPLGALYGGVMDARNRLYDAGIFLSKKVPCPVVSIGNLTLGGTGKTPLVDYAASFFAREATRALILSRGYGGHYRGICKVDPDVKDAAEIYGDEPVLLARRHFETPVYVARNRADAAAEIYAKEKPRVILL
ncbi:MAG: tetraacyldisaccharide 4'-kinase, partial [Bdellovibrionia bacterium]